MKILHLAYRDTSGVPGRWAEAHRRVGHEAELVVELPHPYDYGAPETVIRWSQGAAELLEPFLNADAIMAYDHPIYLETALATGLPVFFRTLGQSAREYAAEIWELLKAPNLVRASAGTPDCALMLDLDLVGAPYPLPEPASPAGGFVLCHSPSDRQDKGTERILRAAEATGWTVDLLEGVPNARVLERKRRADIVVDNCGPGTAPDGYGVNSIEGMALGLPVVASASLFSKRMYRGVGSPVRIVPDEDELRWALTELRDRGTRVELGCRGREFVGDFHSPKKRAAEDMACLYEPVAA